MMPGGRSARGRCLLGCLLLTLGGQSVAGQSSGQSVQTRAGGLEIWLQAVRENLAGVAQLEDASLEPTGASIIVRAYLDWFEPLESWYGPGAPHASQPLASALSRGETRFHALMQATGPLAMRSRLFALRATLDTIADLAEAAPVPKRLTGGDMPTGDEDERRAIAGPARTSEIASILETLSVARTRHDAGAAAEALELVERVYLQSFEPLEPRLPGPVSRKIESLIHLRLRPQLARAAPAADVDATFLALRAALLDADAALAGETTFWFAAVNAFVIIVREGLEAVLLIAAILAYLKGSNAPRREKRRVFAGAGFGIVATFATWMLARTFVPVSGAGRELMEGVTALVAVGVLLWVSHWLFQRTYLHDWKTYVRSRVGQAVTTGSALAMAGLAFAAVYREGFETVLFYQALLFDSSAAAVLAGFLPGLLLIIGLGTGVLRLGVRLPLRMLFGLTNGILLYLAFVFLGKGIYNLQEAGMFAARHLSWLPDHDLLRQLFGFYPTAETVLAQAVYLTLLAGTWFIYVQRRPAPDTRTAPERHDRNGLDGSLAG